MTQSDSYPRLFTNIIPLGTCYFADGTLAPPPFSPKFVSLAFLLVANLLPIANPMLLPICTKKINDYHIQFCSKFPHQYYWAQLFYGEIYLATICIRHNRIPCSWGAISLSMVTLSLCNKNMYVDNQCITVDLVHK